MNAARTLLIAFLAAACGDNPPDEGNCAAEAMVSGSLIEGQSVTTIEGPVRIVAKVVSDVPLLQVRVGDADGFYVPATLTSIADGRWEATLQRPDLEPFRPDGGFTARIPVIAVDLCGGEYPIATSTVALGPEAGVPVDGLEIAFDPPLTDCYVPADGTVSPRVMVTADHDFVGANVTLSANRGTWPNSMATMAVPLADGGDVARVWSVFTPSTPGVATLQVFAGGSQADAPATVVVAPPPTVTASTRTPLRGVTAWLDFSTTGNFDRCDVSEAVLGSTTARLIEPRDEVFTTSIVVREEVSSCAAAEHVRIAISFTTAAPDGASVTVRCRETSYQRLIAETLTVLTPPPPEPPE